MMSEEALVHRFWLEVLLCPIFEYALAAIDWKADELILSYN